MSQEELDPQLAAIEAALSSLEPAPLGTNRDRLMFLAGRAAANAARRRAGRTWIWPVLAAGNLLVALTLGYQLARAPRGGENSETGAFPSPARDMVLLPNLPVSGPDAAAEYLRLRAEILGDGATGPGDSPTPVGTPSAPGEMPTNRHLLRELLPG